jgi:hypothetical protein
MGEEVTKTEKKAKRSTTRSRASVALRHDAVIRVSKRQYDEITSNSSSPVESALVTFLRERNAPAK